MPGAGREALSAAAPGAPEEEPGRLWLALSQAARPTDEQVRGEAATFPMLARRTRALDEDARELSGLLCAEVEGDEAHRRLPTVPGVGGGDGGAAGRLRADRVLPRPRPPGELLRHIAQGRPVGDDAELGLVLAGGEQGAQEPARLLVPLAGRRGHGVRRPL